MSICYSYEPELLGTALGTRQAASLLVPTWPLLVVYGDNLIRLELKEMCRFHEKTGSAVTIAVHEVSDIRESGSVHFDQDGRIQRFIEKPTFHDAVGGWVNAGVYLLEESAFEAIPFDGPTDFGRDIFPGLIHQGFDVFAYCLRGPNEAVYPIDTPQKYRAAVGLLEKQTGGKCGPGAPS
jgi:NDP-sugar pyrophosphorylase family protein